MQQRHCNPDTLDRALKPPTQPRRPKLLAQLRQALCPRHYSRRDDSLGATGGLSASALGGCDASDVEAHWRTSRQWHPAREEVIPCCDG